MITTNFFERRTSLKKFPLNKLKSSALSPNSALFNNLRRGFNASLLKGENDKGRLRKGGALYLRRRQRGRFQNLKMYIREPISRVNELKKLGLSRLYPPFRNVEGEQKLFSTLPRERRDRMQLISVV